MYTENSEADCLLGKMINKENELIEEVETAIYPKPKKKNFLIRILAEWSSSGKDYEAKTPVGVGLTANKTPMSKAAYQPLIKQELVFPGMLAESKKEVLELFKGETDASKERIKEIEYIFALKDCKFDFFDDGHLLKQIESQAFKIIELLFEETCGNIDLEIEKCLTKIFAFSKQGYHTCGGENINSRKNNNLVMYRIPARIMLKLYELLIIMRKNNNLRDISKSIYIGNDDRYNPKKIHLHFKVGLATYCAKEKWSVANNIIV